MKYTYLRFLGELQSVFNQSFLFHVFWLAIIKLNQILENKKSTASQELRVKLSKPGKANDFRITSHFPELAYSQ